MLVTRCSLAVDSPIPPWLVQDSVTDGPRAEALYILALTRRDVEAKEE